MPLPSHQHSPLLHRLVALLGIALVLGLNILAVSPKAHAFLHAAPDHASHAGCKHSAPVSAPEHDCVIAAFAQGHADVGLAPVFLSPVAFVSIGSLIARDEISARTPQFLLPPCCGPPAV